MKVLQITASDKGNGGASRIAIDLHQNLPKIGIETKMFSGIKSGTDNTVYNIPKNILQKVLSRIFASDINFFKTDFILKSEAFKNAEIIQCHNLHGWYFNLRTLEKMSKQKPVVWTLHDMWAITSHCAHSNLNEKKNGLYICPPNSPYPHLLWDNNNYLSNEKSRIFKNSTFYIVSPSQWLAEKIKGTVLENKPIKIIPNGIDVDLFHSIDKDYSRKKLMLPLNKKIVLFISSGGINNPFKGGDLFLDLARKFKKNPDTLFICVGENENITKENILYVKGTSDKSTMTLYLNAADALLFPSKAENFPLTLLEAGACGLPSVAFKIGGIPEIITHKQNGFLCNNINIGELENGLNWILNLTKDEQHKIKINCIQNVNENFSLVKMIESYSNLYNEILKK